MGKLENILAWNLTKVRNKKEVIDEARMSRVIVHFASLMDIFHQKNAELEAKHHKGRVVLHGDLVKDNSGVAERAVRRVKGRHLCCIVAIGSK